MKSFASLAAFTALTVLAAAQSVEDVTEVTDCHFHGGVPHCSAAGEEWQVSTDLEEELAESYTECHSHGDEELHCYEPEELSLEFSAGEAEDTAASSTVAATSSAAASTEASVSSAVTSAPASTTVATVTTSSSAAEAEVTDCHLHGETPYCMAGGNEWEIETDLEDELAEEYTDCHSHGAEELHCASPEDVTLSAASAADEEAHDDAPSATASGSSSASASESVAEQTGNAAAPLQTSGAIALVGAGLAALAAF